MLNSGDSDRSTVLFVADGLRSNVLGPYGNTWFDTQSANVLASQSLLFEQCIADSPDVQLGWRGILSGRHCCDPGKLKECLVDRVKENGVPGIVVTPNAEKVDNPDAFERIVEVDLPNHDEPVGDWGDSWLASYFAAAVQTIRELDQAALLILDCPVFSGSWDAPREFRMRLVDEEDPDPSDLVEPPSLQFNPGVDDPDILFDFQVAYGAQTMLLDRLLGVLLEEVDSNRWLKNALFCLTSTRGFPLGEHGVVGHYRSFLNSEAVNVPMLVRFPRGAGISARTHQLIHPGSIHELILRWQLGDSDIQTATSFPKISLTNFLPSKKTSALVSKCTENESDFFQLQSHAWKYISGPASQLFVKPDDAWEFNDASELCPNIVESMHSQLGQALFQLTESRNPQFDLPDELAFGVE